MGLLDVIVRFHDIRRVQELNRCIFSLATQEYAPAVINIVTQRFSESELQMLEKVTCPLLRLASGVTLRTLNYTDAQPTDARSALLNLGICNSNGRYLAFLDYDDTVYPTSYSKIINRMSETSAAITFGTVAVKTIEVFEDLFLVELKKYPYRKSQVIDLFQNNFCPPNSYVIDRSKIEPGDLYFNPDWTKLEDYHFLIRICAKYESDFHFVNKIIGDYCIKTDGSNTILTPTNQSNQAIEEWTQALKAIEILKANTLISKRVKMTLGLPLLPDVTVADLLRHETNNRMIRLLRALRHSILPVRVTNQTRPENL